MEHESDSLLLGASLRSLRSLRSTCTCPHLCKVKSQIRDPRAARIIRIGAACAHCRTNLCESNNASLSGRRRCRCAAAFAARDRIAACRIAARGAQHVRHQLVALAVRRAPGRVRDSCVQRASFRPATAMAADASATAMAADNFGVVHVAPDDPRVDVYRNLKERDLAGRGDRFILEGENSVHNLVRHGRIPLESVCVSTKRLAAMAPLLEALRDAAVPVYALDAEAYPLRRPRLIESRSRRRRGPRLGLCVETSRRRRGCDAGCPWRARGAAATTAETSRRRGHDLNSPRRRRGGAAATTWIVRGKRGGAAGTRRSSASTSIAACWPADGSCRPPRPRRF